MVELHDYVQFFLVVILFFVLWFYVNIILDFGEFNTKHAPKFLLEKTYTHIKARNIAHIGWLEVVWTIIPIIILTAIAIPSFKLLYALDVVNSPLLTLRCIGNQWYWTYECDITKPQLLTNLQNYLTKGVLVKTAYVNISHFKRQIPSASPDVLNLIENSEIDNLAVDITNDLEEINEITLYIRDRLLHTIRLRLVLHVYNDFSLMNPNYIPNVAAELLTKYVAASFQVDELRNSLLNVADGYDIIEETLPIITQVGKYTDKFHVESESFAVDSYLLDTDDLQLGAFRLLEVDNFPKLPANAEIRLAVTGTDVIHSFAVPSLGVKIDAIPGRLNQFGIRVRVPGTYYGQCSELCGVGHGFMPIKVQFLKLIK